MRFRSSMGCLVTALLVAACSGGSASPGLPSSSTADPSIDAGIETSPSTTIDAAAPSTETDLPVLEDVVVEGGTPTDRSSQLAAQLADGHEPTLQEAIDAFSLTYLPLPGATPSDLPPGDGLGTTYALMLIESQRDRLTDEQRAVVDSLGEGAVSSGTVGPDNAAPPSTETVDTTETTDTTDTTQTTTRTNAPTDPSAPPGSDAATTVGLRSGPLTGQPPVSTAVPLDVIPDLFQVVWRDWRARRPDLPVVTINYEVYPNKMPDRAADAHMEGSVCFIRLFAPTIDPETFADFRFWRYVIAHEMFHCFQFAWGMTEASPGWLVEGGADFAAFDLYRTDSTPHYAEASPAWFFRQDLPLAARKYDAWPLFESVQQWDIGFDVYSAMKTMIPMRGGVEALLTASGLLDDRFLTAWTSLSIRSRRYDEPEWFMKWPSPRPLFGPPEQLASQGPRGVGTYRVIGTGSYSHKPVYVTMTSAVGIATITPLDGPLRTHTASGTVTIPAFTSAVLCYVGDNCVCPGDSTEDILLMDERDTTFSFAAGRDTPIATVVAEKWEPDKVCKPKKPPVGESNGDPHLVTFDGMPYDVMALGEFVLSADPDDEFVVQQRHQPFGFGTGTSAVAIGAGDHRATFTADGTFDLEVVPTVRVDGVEVDGDAPFDVGVAHVRPTGDQEWTITWPDGSAVDLSWRLGFFVTVRPSEERAGRLVGLLGKHDGVPFNDLLTPDGDEFIAGRGTDGVFAPLWQVTNESTLFDYESGESPATFVHPPPPPPPEPAREVVEACRTSLGDEARPHDVRSCAFDVTSTGEDGFVEIYREVVFDRSSASVATTERPSPSTLPSSTTAGATLGLSGTIYDGFSPVGDPAAVPALVGAMDLTEGTVVVATAENCAPDVDVLAQFVRLDTGDRTEVYLCDPYGFNASGSDDGDEVIDGETYVLVTKGGPYEVRVVTRSSEPIYTSVRFVSDASPQVLTPATFLASGFAGTLQGLGDTAYLPMQTGSAFASWSIATSDASALCVNTLYGADSLGAGDIAPLGYCGHPSELATTPTGDLVVTVVAWNRLDTTIEVQILPE